MPLTRVTVKINRSTLKPEDASVNVWHFSHPTELNQSRADELANAVIGFYNGFDAYLSGVVSRAALSHTIELASVTEGAPGAADDVVSKVLFLNQVPTVAWDPAPNAGPLPSEVALAFSFRGDLTGINEEVGSTRPASRRRGRVFLGPFNYNTVTNSTTLEPRPVPALIDAILDSYDFLVAELKAHLEAYQHVIYSRVNGSTFIVVEASVDDSWDTMRSRGLPAASRTTRPVDWTPTP